MKIAALTLVAVLSVWGQSDSRRTRSVSEDLLHATTDQRIATYQKLLAASPSDVKLEIGLISAYLQKLRETSDFGYLDRASKLVAVIRGVYEVARWVFGCIPWKCVQIGVAVEFK